MKRLTDDGNVGVHGQHASPRDGAQLCPLVIHGPRCASQVLVQEPEDDKANDLRQDVGGKGKTLNDKVRDVKVG